MAAFDSSYIYSNCGPYDYAFVFFLRFTNHRKP